MVFLIVFNVQAQIMINEMNASNIDFENGDDCDLEYEIRKVKVGNNFVVIANELENNDPFYLVICNKPLYAKKTFDVDQGNTQYEGDMIIGGIRYYKMEGIPSTNFSYRLLIDDGPTYTYFHLVVKSKILMLPCVRQKGDLRFSMASKVKDSLVATFEDKHSPIN